MHLSYCGALVVAYRCLFLCKLIDIKGVVWCLRLKWGCKFRVCLCLLGLLMQQSIFAKKVILCAEGKYWHAMDEKSLFTVSVIVMREKSIGMAILRRIVVFRCHPKLAKHLLR